MNALIVEDEKTPRELLRDLVPWALHGFDRVDTARNGLEALDLLDQGGVDLVLTDVRMPKMDGVELALEVRRRWPDCVLIFLSGFSDTEYLKTAIRVQAQDYLDKPIDLALVTRAVAEAARTVANVARTGAGDGFGARTRVPVGPPPGAGVGARVGRRSRRVETLGAGPRERRRAAGGRLRRRPGAG
jgi:CheY-like chemotaxis protein